MKKDHFISKGAGKVRKSYPKPVDIAYPQENFVEAYEFNRKTSVRSPVEGYEYRAHMREDDNYYKESKPKEHRLVIGAPHGYGHSIGQRAGKLRLSGKSGAHRIGKR